MPVSSTTVTTRKVVKGPKKTQTIGLQISLLLLLAEATSLSRVVLEVWRSARSGGV